MKITANSTTAAWTKVHEIVNDSYRKSPILTERAGYPVYVCEGSDTTISDLNTRIEINFEDGRTVNVWIEEEKRLSVSGLTFDLYMHYLRDIIPDGKTLPTKVCEKLEYDMMVACFNAHCRAEEATELVRVMEITVQYDTTIEEAYRPIIEAVQAKLDGERAGGIIEEATKVIEETKPRSAWGRGVKAYAVELLADLAEGVHGGYISADDLTAPKHLDRALLNGASSWSHYSWGGCSLIYIHDIAKRLCTPSELAHMHYKDGTPKKPNASEEWLDTQARALYQAAELVKSTVRALVA